MSYANLGPKWTFDWLSYLEDDPANPGNPVNLYVRGGGQETYTGFDGSAYAPHMDSHAQVVRLSTTPIRYERRLPGGGREVFEASDGASISPRRVFMTQSIDAQGKALTFTYDAELRMVAVTDALDQVTTLSYEDPADPLKITEVTDPFGRSATFEYDGNGALGRITDSMGLTSEFGYGSGDFVKSLTTPYGTTRFEMGEDTSVRWVEITDPEGGRERIENPATASIPTSETVAPPGFVNNYLQWRNTLYWDKLAMARHPGDPTKARITHWLHRYPNTNQMSGIKESEKAPLESRVWYRYPDQALTHIEGSGASPIEVWKAMDDGSFQTTRYEYNTQGNRTKEIDPLGRETIYEYAPNGMDVEHVKVKNGAGYDVVQSTTYNGNHQPLTQTDGAGQTTTYTYYTTSGQLETVTTPPRAGITEQRTTTYTYDPVTANLMSVTGPGAVTSSYTYDDYGRLETTTDSDGYLLTYEYDTFDRPTKTIYPDGTYEETEYERLDPVRRRDRAGRITHVFYDGLRRVRATRDPEGRTVAQNWCACGSLDQLIDPNGNPTTWERDVQGRVTKEIRANDSFKTYEYETTNSRLKKVVDAKLQETHYTYALDGKLLLTHYQNEEHETPDVTMSYTNAGTGQLDPHGRVRTVTDGTGVTSYTYLPFGQLGAGQVASVDGPLADDTITYVYDELGRVVSRTLNAVTSTWTYDQQGRLANQGDPIGTFTYTYDGNTGRLLTLTYPNGQTSNYVYYANAQDKRLQEIHHKKPDASTLVRFTYTYDTVGNIMTWGQQRESNPQEIYDFEYDRADQLLAGTLHTPGPSPTILKRYRYAYDPAGNRTAEQIDDQVTGTTYDNMNRLISRQAGGALLFSGSVSEPGSVTVAGKPVAVGTGGAFEGSVPVAAGTSTVTITARDAAGNLRTNVYSINQSGPSTTYTYDANGNTASDGTKAYEWDSQNRVTAVKEGATVLASFSYGAHGQRVEKTAGSVAITWVDEGLNFLEERGSSGPTRRYIYAPGIDRPLAHVGAAGVSYYVADHLGSITHVTDAAGAPILRRSYDPWGRHLTGATVSGFGFTGRELDAETGLHYFRARYYDAGAARFMNEDPIGFGGGRNFYTYVSSNPAKLTDPMGLETGAEYHWQWCADTGQCAPKRCEPSCCTKECLQKVFGSGLPDVAVTPNAGINGYTITTPGSISGPPVVSVGVI